MPQPNENDRWQVLIENARSGCDVSLGKILESVRSYLLLVAEDELGGHVRAKFGASDIVQHSMLEAQDSIGDFRGGSESEFRHWLKRIVVNNVTDESRRYTQTHARNVNLEVSTEQLHSSAPDTGETPSWHIRRKEFDQQLALAVAQLPDRQRYVIEARHRHGYDYSQIASQLEISEAGARKIWSRATEQLRRILEDDSE
jgi:RNA polymerase sigma-70 factor (subfamily 1)